MIEPLILTQLLNKISAGQGFLSRRGKEKAVFHKMKFSDNDIVEIVKLYFTGTPVSVIACAKGVSESSVLSVLRECVEGFDSFGQFRVNYDGFVPEIVEAGEILVRQPGGPVFYAWLAYDPGGRFVIDAEFGERDDEVLENLFRRIKDRRRGVRLVAGGLREFPDAVRKFLD